MKKVLSTLVLTSSLVALFVAPALFVPTTVSAAACTNGCVLTQDCVCGSQTFGPGSYHYCLNGTAYAPTPEGLAVCNAAVSGGTTGAGFQPAPTVFTNAEGLIALTTKVGDWIFSILLGLAAVMLILAGFFWVTAGGDPAGVKKASDMLRNALIGVAIGLGAKGLVLVIRSIIGG